MTRRLTTLIAALAVGAALTAGCSSQVEGSAESATVTGTQAPSSTPTSTSASPASTTTPSSTSTPSSGAAVTLSAADDANSPTLTITPPAGWERSSKQSPSTSGDVIATYITPSLRINGFTPVTTVVISKAPGVTSTSEALSLDKSTAAKSLTGYQETSARLLTVSDNPAQRLLGTWVSTELPTPLTIAVTSVAVQKGAQIYLVDLVSQTTAGDNTAWQQGVTSLHDSLTIS